MTTAAGERTPSRRDVLVRRRATATGRVVEYALAVTLVGVVYYAAGRAGLALAYLDGAVAALWPPVGFGLAALVLYGLRLWPGSPSPTSSSATSRRRSEPSSARW